MVRVTDLEDGENAAVEERGIQLAGERKTCSNYPARTD
jgi:hypothetical protein